MTASRPPDAPGHGYTRPMTPEMNEIFHLRERLAALEKRMLHAEIAATGWNAPAAATREETKTQRGERCEKHASPSDGGVGLNPASPLPSPTRDDAPEERCATCNAWTGDPIHTGGYGKRSHAFVPPVSPAPDYKGTLYVGQDVDIGMPPDAPPTNAPRRFRFHEFMDGPNSTELTEAKCGGPTVCDLGHIVLIEESAVVAAMAEVEHRIEWARNDVHYKAPELITVDYVRAILNHIQKALLGETEGEGK